ncbi:hypothetical protein MUCCIDRAFT_104961 [Mucor lusitanicus CBS 277.49]|uniref:Uncharacterized protein n=1 Tax=Mucor lusitanicus CBS 277.49 TaxID=747725 RepID=A0A168PP45_MUCCL|nr:hypothetical protein MUCCIDRAFT_104961 [Mucor lusitanicus CBS 277.49]
MRSLVYVLQIKGNFNAYIQVTKTSVKEELPDELFKLDLHTNSQKHFCVRQKDHPLHRLFKDNRRFECAINFETEKGEMFNKFIGGQLFLKNHLNPSKDVALRNYKQQILNKKIIKAFLESGEVSLRRESFGVVVDGKYI